MQLTLGFESALGIMEKLAALRMGSFGIFALTTVFSLIFELLQRCVINIRLQIQGKQMDGDLHSVRRKESKMTRGISQNYTEIFNSNTQISAYNSRY